jgi:HKD family nuclease
MRDLTAQALEFWVATAFVTTNVVNDIIAGGLQSGTRIKFLTGTFGRATRRATFKRLLALAAGTSPLQTRVWRRDGHQNFHAKLYLWRLQQGEGVAWIGSANLTDGGLRNTGEILFEIRDRWDSRVFRTISEAFEQEWQRGVPLSSDFVKGYREAPRTSFPPDVRAISRRKQRRAPTIRRAGELKTTGPRRPSAAGFEVWIQPIGPEYWDFLDEPGKAYWGGPGKKVKKGDLVLWYCKAPRSYIGAVSRVLSDPYPDGGRWDTAVDIVNLPLLKSPLSFAEMRRSRRLQGSTFLRRNMQGSSHHATPWWPTLYGMIARRNPSVNRNLRSFRPS